MTRSAQLPPAGLPGLDPTWSRLVDAPDFTGARRTWHVLDTLPTADPQVGTLFCVHGNPTWSYLWRGLAAAPPAGWRVVAVDQLDMGYSQRTGVARTLPDRIADLTGLTRAIGLSGPVVVVAHDWGGPISLGWALGQHDGASQVSLAGLVLTNTGVHQPEGYPYPAVLRMATLPGALPSVTSRSGAFITSALWLSRPAPARDVRAAYHAPYPDAAARAGIEAFVRDIPFAEGHPSRPALDQVAGGLSRLAGVPALLAWGPRDPVFSDIYLRDLITRLPQADVHRYAGSSHLVAEDAPSFPADVTAWVQSQVEPRLRAGQPATQPAVAQGDYQPAWAALVRRAAIAGEAATGDQVAVVELAGRGREITFAELERRSSRLSSGLRAWGLGPGDRVALLVPPGVDLAVCLFGVWRAGGVAVVVDAGLGLRGMRGALLGAGPKVVIGAGRGMAAARAMHLRARLVLAGSDHGPGRAAAPEITLPELERMGVGLPLPAEPDGDDDALIAFTSGATGPAKGVRYRHRQVAAQRDALAGLFEITDSDALVAGFGPFALIAPVLGIPCAVPDMDIMAPRTLSASALAQAVAAVSATLVFAAPAALANLAATAAGVDDPALAGVRGLLSAGAPVPAELLARLTGPGALLPNAVAHTPYGMTECLPATDITLEQMRAAGPGNGVCVGWPVPGLALAISALDQQGRAVGELSTQPEVTGEICVHAPHVKQAYDRLWVTQSQASASGLGRTGWHRTGDVGHLDSEGRLWVEGRAVHVITTAAGPVTPVGVENALLSAGSGVTRAAAVGVGPAGAQVVVAVLEVPGSRAGLAPAQLRDGARAAVGGGVDLVAVLVVPELPTDIRHNSKIDRLRVGRWAGRVLSGSRGGRL